MQPPRHLPAAFQRFQCTASLNSANPPAQQQRCAEDAKPLLARPPSSLVSVWVRYGDGFGGYYSIISTFKELSANLTSFFFLHNQRGTFTSSCLHSAPPVFWIKVVCSHDSGVSAVVCPPLPSAPAHAVTSATQLQKHVPSKLAREET